MERNVTQTRLQGVDGSLTLHLVVVSRGRGDVHEQVFSPPAGWIKPKPVMKVYHFHGENGRSRAEA
jgi:hypothetical protein